MGVSVAQLIQERGGLLAGAMGERCITGESGRHDGKPMAHAASSTTVRQGLRVGIHLPDTSCQSERLSRSWRVVLIDSDPLHHDRLHAGGHYVCG